MLRLVMCLVLITCGSLGIAAEKKATKEKKAAATKDSIVVVKSDTAALATTDDTIKALKTAIAKDTGKVNAHYDLGLIYYVNKQWYAKAIEEWNRVAQLTPKDGKVHFQIAWTYYRKLRNLQAAENEALAAVELGKTDKEKKYWYALSLWILTSIYEDKSDSLNAQRCKDEWQQLSELSQKQQDATLDYLKREVDALRKDLNINKQ